MACNNCCEEEEEEFPSVVEECIIKCSHTMNADCIIVDNELSCLDPSGTTQKLSEIISIIDARICDLEDPSGINQFTVEERLANDECSNGGYTFLIGGIEVGHICNDPYFQATDIFTYEGEDSITALEFTYCPEMSIHIISVYVNGMLIPPSGWTFVETDKCRVNLVTPMGSGEYAQIIYWVDGLPTEGLYNEYALGV